MNIFVRWWIYVTIAVVGCLAMQSQAATKDNFLARDTQDIIELCSVSPEDPIYTEAIHFCHGFLIGAYRYQKVFYSRPGFSPLVCAPEPNPSPTETLAEYAGMTRTKIIAEYVQWTKNNPEYLKEPIVDTLMKFLIDKFPCKD